MEMQRGSSTQLGLSAVEWPLGSRLRLKILSDASCKKAHIHQEGPLLPPQQELAQVLE